ncbi:hypothetical protein ACH5RR_018702 [Cinchona calisaya]|uniref:Transposase n=1 Tax=Cinchona calisaya TaxID=153742 RepID=A0ABD2ZNH0_9GENT
MSLYVILSRVWIKWNTLSNCVLESIEGPSESKEASVQKKDARKMGRGARKKISLLQVKVTEDEIINVMFNMPNGKSTRPDGYTTDGSLKVMQIQLGYSRNYEGEGSSREIGHSLGKENNVFLDNVSWVEKLETSSNDNDYHKEVSYLAVEPHKEDPLEPKWNVVVKMTLRDLFNIDLEIYIYAEMQNEDVLLKHCNNYYSDDGIFPWIRESVDGVTLDVPTPKSSTHIIESGDDFIEDDEYSSYEDDLGCDNTNGDISGDDEDFFDEFQQGDKDDN